jgi:(E)-4-hydroxy-3-methylbut-2-enyl-diphosphate synthase
VSCPSCGRAQVDVYTLANEVTAGLEGMEVPLRVAVMGCVVNGPGEARETDIGFTGGGNGTHQVYIAGVPHHRLKDADIVDHLVELIEKKAAEIEAAKTAAAAAEASGTKSAAE